MVPFPKYYLLSSSTVLQGEGLEDYFFHILMVALEGPP